MAFYVLLGPPGAGKGTLAEDIRKRFPLVHISTGDMLREEIKAKTDRGRQVKAAMDAGSLVPDEMVSAIVAARISKPDVALNGGLLDGFPRTLKQAHIIDDLLRNDGLALDQVLLLGADTDQLIRRLTARRTCMGCGRVFNIHSTPAAVSGICDGCGGHLQQRDDDTEATAIERLRVYRQQTEPLVGFYEQRGILTRLDTGRHREAVAADACRALGLT